MKAPKADPGSEERHSLNGDPRSYSIHPVTLRGMDAIVTAPLGIVVGVSALYMFGLTQNTTPFGLFAAGALAVLVAFLGYRVNRRRVVLYEDGIAILGAFSRRTLKRNEILGRRMGKLPVQAGGGSFYIIVPTDRNAKELRLPPFLAVDKYFFSWMKGIPMLESKGRGAASR